jgi:hypothetical protein
MRRRALLASLTGVAAGLAGCSFASGQPSDDPANGPKQGPTTRPPSTETPTSPGSDDMPEPPETMASVIDLETGPRTYAFAPTHFRPSDEAAVSLWFDRTATADHPARLRGVLENTAEYATTIQVEWIPAVGRTYSRNPEGYDHEARLQLPPTEQNELADRVPDLTRTEAGYWRRSENGPTMPETVRLDAGERVELAYAVVGDPGLADRPTGHYEFRGDDATASIHVWQTDQPGPTATSRFAGQSVPALSEETSTAWYHDADATTAVSLRPAREQVALDGRVAFELVNHSARELSCGHWNLYKLADGEWYHVGPNIHTSDCRLLAPGGHQEWALRAFNSDAVPCGEHAGAGCGDGLTRGYLGGGTYAVVAGYGHPADQSGALIELVGDSVTLEPAAEATIDRRGSTVTVQFPEYGDGEHPPDASFTLSRADGAEERLIAEQVVDSGGFAGSGRGLRTALAALDADAERVEVRADEHIVDAATDHDSTSRRFRFRGQAYQVTQVAPE